MRLESFKKWEQFTGSYKKSVNPINLVEIPESSERRFYHLLQKLVDCKQITSSLADKAKQEFRKFKCNIVRENKAIFGNYDIDKNLLDEFYMEYWMGIFLLCCKNGPCHIPGQANVKRWIHCEQKFNCWKYEWWKPNCSKICKSLSS